MNARHDERIVVVADGISRTPRNPRGVEKI